MSLPWWGWPFFIVGVWTAVAFGMVGLWAGLVKLVEWRRRKRDSSI